MTRLSRAETAYRTQKKKSEIRNIDFEMTFDEWYQWWLSHGIDRQQPLGKTAKGWCMCRVGDQGGYKLDNIYLATRSQNSKDGKTNFPPTGRKSGFARRVQTPDGIFDSIYTASDYYDVTPEAIGWRIAHWEDWNYIDSSKNGNQIQTPAGMFSSQRQAAKAMGVPVSTIQRRRVLFPKDYYYV
jgi:hypothetical protein